MSRMSLDRHANVKDDSVGSVDRNTTLAARRRDPELRSSRINTQATDFSNRTTCGKYFLTRRQASNWYSCAGSASLMEKSIGGMHNNKSIRSIKSLVFSTVEAANSALTLRHHFSANSTYGTWPSVDCYLFEYIPGSGCFRRTHYPDFS